ncbi:MAG: hypothetical protein P8Y70_15605 [Candidatus Lokiarchaeota archaeon]
MRTVGPCPACGTDKEVQKQLFALRDALKKGRFNKQGRSTIFRRKVRRNHE